MKNVNKQKTKRQHIVPKSILRLFTNKDGLLWTYNVDSKIIRCSLPKKVGFITEFYTIQDKNGKDYSVEEMLGSEIEGSISKIIKKIEKKELPNNSEKIKLAKFISYQRLRTEDFRSEFIRLNKTEAINQTNKLYKENRITNKSKNTILKLISEKTKEYKNESIKAMVSISEKIFQEYLKKDWLFIIAPKSTAFVISDNHYIHLNPHGYNKKFQSGINTQGSRQVIHLSSNLALILEEKGNKMQFKKINKNIVKLMNEKTTKQSKRWICAKDEKLLKRMIKRHL